MRTNLDSAEPFWLHDAFVSDSDLMGFNHPGDIVDDPVLTLERKRQLLAYWGSDIHAVAGSPALRAYDCGPAVSIDKISEALCALDEMVDLPALSSHSSTGAAAG